MFQSYWTEKPTLIDYGRPRTKDTVADVLHPHAHTLSLCLKPFKLSTKGLHYEMKPGYIFLIPSKQASDYFYMNNNFKATILFAIFKTDLKLDNYALFRDTEKDFRWLKTEFIKLIDFAESDITHAEIILWNILRYHEKFEPFSSIEGDEESIISPIISKVNSYIDKRLDQGISIQEMSEELNITQKRLSKTLSEFTGQTTVRYIHYRRMNKVEVLLRDANSSIKEVAAKLGYGDLHYFNKCVKRYYGRSPSAIRESLGD